VRSFDVAIAGGGIVGAACAFEFAQAGLRVAVIEPHIIGGGATAAGMGHLAVMDDSSAQFALTRYSQLLWKELAAQLPPEAEYLPCGALWVAADEFEMQEVFRKHAFYTAHGVPSEVLDAQALAQAEPNLRPGLAGGLLLKDDAAVYPPCVAHFLTQGATVILGQKVTGFNEQSVTLDNGERLSAGVVVLAAGALTFSLVPGIEIQPRKGHLVITDRYPGFLRHQTIELGYLKSAHSLKSDSVAFNVQPRQTGQILIGSSRQYGVAEPAIDYQILSRMLSRALEYMPALGRLSAIRAWTGFRAATPDKVPLIGLCPGYKTVYLATGHEGLGIVTSLGTARLLADLVLDQAPEIDPAPYSPSRSYAVHA
jgi:D-hydroxyproline dehydrogenase subunit beta